MAAKLKDGVFLGVRYVIAACRFLSRGATNARSITHTAPQDYECAQDLEFILANKITHIICCAGREVRVFC